MILICKVGATITPVMLKALKLLTYPVKSKWHANCIDLSDQYDSQQIIHQPPENCTHHNKYEYVSHMDYFIPGH